MLICATTTFLAQAFAYYESREYIPAVPFLPDFPPLNFLEPASRNYSEQAYYKELFKVRNIRNMRNSHISSSYYVNNFTNRGFRIYTTFKQPCNNQNRSKNMEGIFNFFDEAFYNPQNIEILEYILFYTKKIRKIPMELELLPALNHFIQKYPLFERSENILIKNILKLYIYTIHRCNAQTNRTILLKKLVSNDILCKMICEFLFDIGLCFDIHDRTMFIFPKYIYEHTNVIEHVKYSAIKRSIHCVDIAFENVVIKDGCFHNDPKINPDSITVLFSLIGLLETGRHIIPVESCVFFKGNILKAVNLVDQSSNFYGLTGVNNNIVEYLLDKSAVLSNLIKYLEISYFGCTENDLKILQNFVDKMESLGTVDLHFIGVDLDMTVLVITSCKKFVIKTVKFVNIAGSPEKITNTFKCVYYCNEVKSVELYDRNITIEMFMENYYVYLHYKLTMLSLISNPVDYQLKIMAFVFTESLCIDLQYTGQCEVLRELIKKRSKFKTLKRLFILNLQHKYSGYINGLINAFKHKKSISTEYDRPFFLYVKYRTNSYNSECNIRAELQFCYNQMVNESIRMRDECLFEVYPNKILYTFNKL